MVHKMHHQSWSPEHNYTCNNYNYYNRQNTDKQNHTEDKKEQGGLKCSKSYGTVTDLLSVLKATRDV